MTDLAVLTLIGRLTSGQCRRSPSASAIQHLRLRIRLDLLHAMQFRGAEAGQVRAARRAKRPFPSDRDWPLLVARRWHAAETWEYVNWLTYAKNAVRMDAEIGLKAVEHLLGMFTAARLRLGRASLRCEECGSYQVVGGECRHCGWVDPSYEPPQARGLSERSGHGGSVHRACPARISRPS